MALTKGPLMSLDASGSVAKTITFSKWKGRNYVRHLVIPHNPKSGLQVGMRASLKFVTQAYAALSATIKSHWKTVATPQGITPLNAQVQQTQRSVRAGNGPIQDPTAAAGTTPSAPATQTTTPLVKSALLALTSGANVGQYTNMWWMSNTTGFTPSAATLVEVIAVATLSVTIPNLITGQTYYFRSAQSNYNGVIGALHAETSALIL